MCDAAVTVEEACEVMVRVEKEEGPYQEERGATGGHAAPHLLPGLVAGRRAEVPDPGAESAPGSALRICYTGGGESFSTPPRGNARVLGVRSFRLDDEW